MQLNERPQHDIRRTLGPDPPRHPGSPHVGAIDGGRTGGALQYFSARDFASSAGLGGCLTHRARAQGAASRVPLGRRRFVLRQRVARFLSPILEPQLRSARPASETEKEELKMNSVAESSLSLEISRRFDAPPERVFDAWLGKEWGEWLPPRGARCKVDRIEPRVGGQYHVAMNM